MAEKKESGEGRHRTSVRLLLTHIALMVLLSIVIIVVSLILLDVYTLHGKSTVVPDVLGRPIEEAQSMLKKQHLAYEIIDSIYTKDALPGSVQDIQPKVGSRVKPNRTMFIVINSNQRPQVVIPSLSDMSLRQAEATLQGLGFTQLYVKYVAGEYDNLTQGVANSSGQVLSPGQRVDISTPLTLIVTTNNISKAVDSTSLSVDLNALPAAPSFPTLEEDTLTTDKNKEKLSGDETWW